VDPGGSSGARGSLPGVNSRSHLLFAKSTTWAHALHKAPRKRPMVAWAFIPLMEVGNAR
jgi:hypothetical protein